MSCRNNEQCTNSQVQRENTNQEQDKHEPLKKRNNSLKKNNIVITRVRQFSSIRTLKNEGNSIRISRVKISQKKPEPIHAHSLRTTQMPPDCHCN